MRKFVTCFATAVAAASLSTTVLAQENTMKLDFETPASASTWQSVNDGVMGGRSSGAPSFENGHMVFQGIINTNGGGFSSVRTFVPPGQLSNASGLAFRVRSDGRAYKVTLRTNARYRFRPISFQAEIPVATSGEWTEVSVPFTALDASVFGRSIGRTVFDKSEIQELGIILADGQDGPFRLEIESIRAISQE